MLNLNNETTIRFTDRTSVLQYGVCDRLDQEAPVPIFKEENEVVYEGMSLNVANNIASFGLSCELITNKKTMA